MGVKGLWSLLNPVARPVQIESMEGKRLAIDSSIWLYQFQATMRDKDGRVLVNAHVLGFLRRINKLLFHGIKPVFVFDGGAPALKRNTIAERKRRKAGAAANHARMAEKLFAAQMRREAVKAAQAQRDAQAARTASSEAIAHYPDEAGEQIADNVVYLEELEGRPGPSMPRPVVPAPTTTTPDEPPDPAAERRKRFKKHDPYRLPEATMPTVSTEEKPDARLATEAELQQFIDDMRPSDIDVESAEFRALPTEVQYEIIGDLRIRSRQQSHRRLADMLRAAPTALDFSMAQIKHLSQRNALTQQLLTVTDMVGKAHLTIPVRIAAERNREYVLVKRGEDEGGGWALGIREGTKAKPIEVEPDDETNSEASDDSDYTDDMVERSSDVQAISPPPKPAVVDTDLAQHRRQEMLEAIVRRYAPAKPAKRSLDVAIKPFGRRREQGDAPLFEAADEEEEIVPTANDEALALALQQEELGQDEEVPDQDLARALAMSRRDAEARETRIPSPSEAEELEVEMPKSDASDESMEEVSLVPSGRTTPQNLSESQTPFDIAEEAEMEDDDFEIVEPPKVMPTSRGEAEGLTETGLKEVDKELEREVSTPTVVRQRRVEAASVPAPAITAHDDPATLSPGFSSPAIPAAPVIDVPVPPPPVPSRAPAAPPRPAPTISPGRAEPSIAMRVVSIPTQTTPTIPAARPPHLPQRASSGSRPAVPSPLGVSSTPKRGFTEIPVIRKPPPAEPRPPAPPITAMLEPISVAPLPTRAESVTAAPAQPHLAEAEAGPSRSASFARTASTESAVTMADEATEDEDEEAIEDSRSIEWSRSPSPAALSRPPLQPAQSGETIPSEVEDEDVDMAPEDMVAENDDYARFLAQIKNRDLNEVRGEIDDEIRVLHNQNKLAMRDSDEITLQMVAQIQTLLRHFGIPYITAPMEAEAQCAKLAELDLVDGIITDDSDVFLFGGKQCFKNIFNDAKYAECFVLADVERELSLTRERLISLAYFLGSDYTVGLPGVGPVVALELLSNFPGPNGIFDFKDWWTKVQRGQDTGADLETKWKKSFKKRYSHSVFLTAEWPNPLVREAYLYPTTDESKEPFHWGFPKLSALRAFLHEELSWSISKVDDELTPIVQRIARRGKVGALNKQATLDPFFDLSAGAGNYAPRKRTTANVSKRLMGVIKAYREAEARVAGKEVGPGWEVMMSGLDEEDPKGRGTGKRRRTMSESTAGVGDTDDVEEGGGDEESQVKKRKSIKKRASEASVGTEGATDIPGDEKKKKRAPRKKPGEEENEAGRGKGRKRKGTNESSASGSVAAPDGAASVEVKGAVEGLTPVDMGGAQKKKRTGQKWRIPQ